ncbi:hypothetical protein GLAREA_08712 [Glarea lozoyensis ATCC 20868]|uniref:Uncharacterized protein n=1 Tax=Glarea lozoyensis (strain ATCC 20868 / MF5171) TaxID=1116229 RepID=S3DHB4_GLAL2|nr:uncharacterized protein GLAREA_08712 [Glarea lozoyensis ATCC 20868]EPE36549.1 hypothetical protein GLAREA_08712 [Glarea lozoyensis ATCC 20868]
MACRLKTIPAECMDQILDYALVAEFRDRLVLKDRNLWEQRWDITGNLFSVDKEGVSQRALEHFYDKNHLVRLECDRALAYTIGKIIPILELNPGSGTPDHALSINISCDGDGNGYTSSQDLIIISGKYLPRLVALLNSMQDSDVDDTQNGFECDFRHQHDGYGTVAPEIRYDFNRESHIRLGLDFTVSSGGYYENRHDIAIRLVNSLQGLCWPKKWWSCRQPPKNQTYFLLKPERSPSYGFDKIAAKFGIIYTEEEFIHWATAFKKEADEFALEPCTYPQARAYYVLAGSMLLKNAFSHYETINGEDTTECHIFFKASEVESLPVPRIRAHCLELWVSSSQFSQKLATHLGNDELHLEALATANLAFRVCERHCSRGGKARPELLLKVKLQYADTLQEAQRRKRGDEVFLPRENCKWYDTACHWPHVYEEGAAFRLALTLLTGARDMYPDDENVRERLAACRALHEPKDVKGNEFEGYVSGKGSAQRDLAGDENAKMVRVVALRKMGEFDGRAVAESRRKVRLAAEDESDILSTMVQGFLDPDNGDESGDEVEPETVLARRVTSGKRVDYTGFA